MQEKLFFKNSKGNKLCGILSSVNKNIIIILCHGFSSNKDSQTFPTLERIFNDKNISTFRFDFYGHGESGGKFEDITISEAVDDILNAIKFLKNKKFKKIGLVGSSFGGMASIIAASKSKDLYILALKSPVSNQMEKLLVKYNNKNVKKWKEKGFIYYESGKLGKLKLNYSFFEDSMKINGYEAAKKISIPTLVVHGDKDESVPIEQSIRLSKIIKNCKLEIIKDADHRYTKPEYFEKCINLISNFIIKNS